MDGQIRIERMYAFIVLDDDGTEGIPALRVGPDNILHPLVGADMAMVDKLRPIAFGVAQKLKKKVTLAVFAIREDLEVFPPGE